MNWIKEKVKSFVEKAKQTLKILTKKQLNFIKSKFDTGGAK